MQPFSPYQSKDHFIAKSLYFLIFAAIGLFNSYLILYYRSIGFSGLQIGLITSLASLVSAFSSTLMGILQDRYGKTRFLFAVACVGCIILAPIISITNKFLITLPIITTYALFASPILALIDSNTIRVLGPRPDRYGVYRLWGTLGFIVTNPLAGYLYQRYGLNTMFYAYPVSMLIFLLACLLLPDQPSRKGLPMFKGMGNMIRQPIWLLFALSAFLAWFAGMGGLSFVSVAIKDMGGTSMLVGLASTMAAISEIPLMMSSIMILHRFDARKMIAFSFLAYAVRLFLYSIMTSPTWVPWINILQSVSYVLFNIGTVSYANQLAPDELKATSQGMLYTVLNLANLSSGLTCGILYDQAGRASLFLILSCVAFLALVIFLFGQYLLQHSSKQSILKV